MIYVLTIFLVSTVASESGREYNGVFCGLIKESEDPVSKFRQNYNCFGSVWAMDAKRLKVKSFTFQPAFWHVENITFWLGPATKTDDEFHDMMPNDNGLYLEPQVVVPLFGLDVPQTIFAKRPTTEEVLSIFKPKKSKNNVPENPKPEPEPVKKLSFDISKPEPQSSKLNPLKTKLQKAVPEPGLQIPKAIPEPKSLVSNPKPEPKSKDHFRKLSDPSTGKNIHGIHNLDANNVTIAGKLNDLPFENDKFDLWQDPFNLTFVDKINIAILNYSNIPNLEFDSDSVSIATIVDHNKDDEKSVQMEALIIVASNETAINQSLIDDQNLDYNSTLLLNYAENFDFLTNQTLSIIDKVLMENATIFNESMTETTTIISSTIATTTTSPKIGKSLSWYTGNDVLLALPESRSLSDFRWLSIYDHKNKRSIATVFLPNGKRFFYPSTLVLKGFKPNLLTKDVRSEAIEILDTKTIRIRKFTFEGDAPGAWFMVGKTIFPTVGGQIAPILKSSSAYDCNFLKAYENEDIIIKMPGSTKTNEIFWLSVFCIPYSISFAQVYLPYKDMTVPMSSGNDTVPNCVLE